MRVEIRFPQAAHLVSYRQRVEVLREAVECGAGGRLQFFAKHFGYPRPTREYVFDVCDDHFGGEHRDYYRQMCLGAVGVSCSSEGLREIIGKETGREAVVIHEPYEYAEREAVEPTGRKVLWYGHAANLKVLGGVLAGLDLRGRELRVVTNVALEDHPNMRCFLWSVGEVERQLGWCDTVIIPQDRLWKSPNRMIEAIRAGRFVVASDIPAYRGYGMYLGDIGEGLKWVERTSGLRKVVKAAQAQIREPFSREVIRRQWSDFISAAERSCGTGGSTSMDSTPAMSPQT